MYKATCPETGCEHAAKFLTVDGGQWECAMAARVLQSQYIVRVICSGLTKNPIACANGGQRSGFVILSELMSEDLFSAVFTPCWLSKSLVAKGCALKHIAYQVLRGIQGQFRKLDEVLAP